MTYPEIYSAIHEQGKTTVLIFNGGTEQRGPHAVLGGHTFIARSVADEIARKLGNALVAPVLPFSPTDAFVKPQWPGTISVSTELYTKMNEAVVADMVVAGFKNIVLMGDHGGGQKQLEELADSLNAKYSPEGVHVLYCGAAYTKARDDFRPPAHGKPVLLRSFGSEEAQPAVFRGRPGPLGADHVCATFLDAEVRDVA